MRERLIELLEKGQELYYDSYGQAGVFYKEFIADYLLANGVIVPPCKVGTRLYRLVARSRGVSSKRVYSHIRETHLTYSNLSEVIYNFGNTVFLTREEAMQALKKQFDREDL